MLAMWSGAALDITKVHERAADAPVALGILLAVSATLHLGGGSQKS